MDSLHLRLGLDQKQSVCSIATRCKIEHIHVAELGAVFGQDTGSLTCCPTLG